MVAAPPQPPTREERIKYLEERGYTYAYGSVFEPLYDDKGRITNQKKKPWVIEREILRAKNPWRRNLIVLAREKEKPKGYLGYVEHFKRFVSAIWGPDNPILAFEWNPNAELIVEELFDPNTPFLGIAGHKNSSKTETLAVIAVALFLINPKHTKVIATSLTLKAAQAKIWGRILMAWQAACQFAGGEKNLPGEHSLGIIKYREGDFKTATAGIELVAGEQSQAKQTLEKIQGIKAEYVFVAADELATLAPGVVETCRDNLTGNEWFKFCGSYNPHSYYDASRLVSEPIDGWGSITVDSRIWRTRLGSCIHFDGTKSPNVIAGEKLWKGLYTREQLLQDREYHHGENTPGFWKFVRGFWSPMGADDAIYSGPEIVNHRADAPMGTHGCFWAETPIPISGLDPSFVRGGDRAIAYYGKSGTGIFEDGTRRQVCEWTEGVELAADVTLGQDKSLAVAQAYKKESEQRGVILSRCGVDCTGAAPFASVLRTVWGDGFLEVVFSESPSDSPLSETDPRPAKERYRNKRDEIWFSAKPLIRSGQIRGIDPDLAAEMCASSFQEVGGKIQVESKEDMKKRTGRSPDRAEAAFVCLQVARELMGLISTEKSRKPTGSPGNDEDGGSFMRWAQEIQEARAQSLDFDP